MQILGALGAVVVTVIVVLAVLNAALHLVDLVKWARGQ